MKIVNTSELPKEIFAFLSQDFYDREAVKDSISATTLLKPIQEIILTKRYWDKIEIDAGSRIWSLFGSGVHAILEKLRGDKIEQVPRMFAEVEGIKVSGELDLISDGIITDYKVTSVWTKVFGSREEDYIKQLSIYRWLYFKVYGTVLSNKGNIISIYRDWEKRKVSGKYPERPIEKQSLNLMALVEIENWITAKVRAIKSYTNAKDQDLEQCSQEERWYSQKDKISRKCQSYCPAKLFCSQYNNNGK